jgi:sugar O-acyltransferase (sialic acid O-acetyltransferase NeuD family)
MNIVLLPTLNVNEDSALIYWEADQGASIRKGQVIALMEVSKATVEMEAESDGFLYQLVKQGESADFGSPLAVIHEQAGLSDDEIRKLAIKTPEPTVAGEKQWTKKAELLAAANKIAIDEVPAAGEKITESDVRAYIESRKQTSTKVLAPDVSGVSDTADELFPANRRKRLLLIGAGAAAILVLDVVFRGNQFKPVGILDDDKKLHGKTIFGVPVLGNVEKAATLYKEGFFDEVITSISTALVFRRKVFSELREQGIPFANIVDPSAVVHMNVQMGQGNIILGQCRVGPCTIVGDNNFVSAYTNLEHHNRLGSHCTFGPMVSTSGLVEIGDSVKFGTGIFIEPFVKVGDESVIASGAVLVAPVAPNSLVRTKMNYTVRPRA